MRINYGHIWIIQMVPILHKLSIVYVKFRSVWTFNCFCINRASSETKQIKKRNHERQPFLSRSILSIGFSFFFFWSSNDNDDYVKTASVPRLNLCVCVNKLQMELNVCFNHLQIELMCVYQQTLHFLAIFSISSSISFI